MKIPPDGEAIFTIPDANENDAIWPLTVSPNPCAPITAGPKTGNTAPAKPDVLGIKNDKTINIK